MNGKTKKLTTIAMLCTITYVVMAVGRIPVVLFLKYDPSDVIVALSGFIWGPTTSCIVSVAVAVIEMITVSETGIWGCIMNIIQTLSFACTAAVIYKKKHTLAGAVSGLLYGISARGCCRNVSSGFSSIQFVKGRIKRGFYIFTL